MISNNYRFITRQRYYVKHFKSYTISMNAFHKLSNISQWGNNFKKIWYADIGHILHIFLNRDIVILQYCTAQCISYMYVCVYVCVCVCVCVFPPSWPLPHPIHLGHHTAPSWTPCSIQQVPTSYLFYTWLVYIYQCESPNSSHPLHPHICS